MLSCEPNIYFSKNYLKAFDTANSSEIDFNYIVIFNQEEPVALATIQVLDYNIDTTLIASNTNKIIEKLSYHLSCFLKRDYLKIIICGNAFLSGEHGIFIKDTQDKKTVLEHVVKGIHDLVNNDESLKKHTDVILIKDFISESLHISDNLKQYNFTSVNVDPTMVLSIDSNWSTFDDYLQAFKSKFRVKAKKAYKTSAKLIEKDLSANEIIENRQVLTSLYNNVIDKSSFNIGTLNLDTYIQLKELYPDDFIVKTYWLNNTMVGFMSGMINQKKLDAHFIGIDYELNKEHAIYSRMLYDYVKLGIEKGLSQVNFGRTSGEIKSTLGALPQELTFYVRHKKSVANFFFKPFLNRIKPKPFEQRSPFKKEKPVTVT